MLAEKGTNRHICIAVVFFFSFSFSVLPSPIQFDRKYDYRPPHPLPHVVYSRKRETRCVCVCVYVVRGRSLWLSLCTSLRLVHRASLTLSLIIRYTASCWGGQVLLGLSCIHPNSRCLMQTDTHTHRTHTYIYTHPTHT